MSLATTTNLRSILALCLLCLTCCQQAFAQTNRVNGNLFTLTDTATAPNGVWSWFEDERAIMDLSNPNDPRLIVSSVSAGAAPENGDVDLLWRNLTTGTQGHFELANQLEQDDHNSAALYQRPDGRYLAMYSRHNTDSVTRWRVSTNPNDPTSWGAEQTLTNAGRTTYNNVYYLPSDNNGAGRLYNFTRTVNFDPNVQVSSDDGSTWANAGKLLTEGGSGDRPYVRYASDGKKIFLMTTERHPRNFANSVYGGYVRDGVLHRMDGSIADSSVFDANGVAPATLSTVFRNGSQFGGTTLNRAWTINLEIDKAGNPVGIISARVNDSDQDHRFLYARYDGVDWQVNELAKAGGFLYAAENDYTGLVSIDPNNPNVVYMSTPIDPRSNAATSKYELYKGFTSDFGKSWAWSPITENSTVDNLRPVVPDWNGRNTALTWLRGDYTTFTNWSTEVVGINFASPDPKALLWRGDASGAVTLWNNAATANWDSGGGLSDVFQTEDEVTFGDSATSTTVNVQSTVMPMSVTFANETKSYQLTGTGGIAGSGGLRVIGGANVTLANGNNTYTGDTEVARGTLALSANTQLSGTQSIHVASQATLNVSGMSSGSYSLEGQTLQIDGTVVGNIMATQTSNVELSAGAVFDGNLSLSNSTIAGGGTVKGNLVAANGAVIQVGLNGMTGVRALTYLDATTGVGGNTTLANGATFTPTVSTSGSDALTWIERSFGNQGTVLQGGASSPATLPTLRSTISGLNPGEQYQVYANYWDAEGTNAWRILAGTSPTNLTLFDAAGDNVAGAVDGVLLTTLPYATQPLSSESDRRMWAGNLGQLVADANGRISVFIDDVGGTATNDRTWYDGLSYVGSESVFTGQSTLIIENNLSMDALSRLRMEIGNLSSFDRLSILGSATLGGTLEVGLATNGKTLLLGDSFDILDFSSSSGQFANFELPTLSNGLAWDTSRLYSSGILRVGAAAVPEPSTLLLLASCGLGLWIRHQRQRKQTVVR
jgi:autotransporter-associated beta strand protein